MSALHALSELWPGEQHERCAGERSGYRREEQVARRESNDEFHDECADELKLSARGFVLSARSSELVSDVEDAWVVHGSNHVANSPARNAQYY